MEKYNTISDYFKEYLYLDYNSRYIDDPISKRKIIDLRLTSNSFIRIPNDSNYCTVYYIYSGSKILIPNYLIKIFMPFNIIYGDRIREFDESSLPASGIEKAIYDLSIFSGLIGVRYSYNNTISCSENEDDKISTALLNICLNKTGIQELKDLCKEKIDIDIDNINIYLCS